ncbi:hypothetical protein LQW54_008087 [Pestalotiopsis sp. IQ-011]
MPGLGSETIFEGQASRHHDTEPFSPVEDPWSKNIRSLVQSQNREFQEEAEKRVTAQKAIEQARGSLERTRILELAKQSFHSHAGIIYVADDLWMRLSKVSGPCHLYVSLQAVDKFPSREAKPSVFLTDNGPPALKLDGLPPRFKIVNQVLHEDMAAACGLTSVKMNHNHRAPFRSIIPFEKIFRQRLLDAEEAFTETATAKPNHFAVSRPEPNWVPHLDKYSYGVQYPVAPVQAPPLAHLEARHLDDDEVIRARLLRDGYRALIHLLDHELHDLVQDYRKIQDATAERLPFPHLWHLFQPGQEIVTKGDKIQVYRVLQVTGGRGMIWRKSNDLFKKHNVSNLVIDCFHLDFDGQEFGPVAHTTVIKPYEGTKAINQLRAYPLVFHPETNLSQTLTVRGEKFAQLIEASHRKYKGLSLKWTEPFDNVEEIDGDVMVDFKLAYRSSEPQRKVESPRFRGGVIDEPTIEEMKETFAKWDDGTVEFDNPTAISERWLQWSQNTPLLDKLSPDALTRDCYNLLPPRVWGYVFLRRKWYPLDIDNISPAGETSPGFTDAFDKLVLPDGHKDIVRALVQTHAQRQSSSLQREFDLIKHKGKGLIILLHGAPGVGKTSTAECVAANAKKPLFPITIGDVGAVSATEVEQNLEKFFDLARKWNCVLLLDEADVFLSTRVEGNIAQNSLVSVFLRALEYYSGILILTTNRVGSFDEAIKSRVHCALYYPPLDKDQTIAIWQMKLKSLEERNAAVEPRHRIQFDPKEIEDYARRHWRQGKRSSRWNGRQIKNAFQTAVALADWDALLYTKGKGMADGTPLTRKHFEKVAEASEHFDIYLERTRTSDRQRARDGGFRDDNITSKLNDFRLNERSDSDEDTESEVERKKKKKSSKKSSAKKSKSSKDKGSKSKKHRKEESEEESTEGTESEETTS